MPTVAATVGITIEGDTQCIGTIWASPNCDGRRPARTILTVVGECIDVIEVIAKQRGRMGAAGKHKEYTDQQYKARARSLC